MEDRKMTFMDGLRFGAGFTVGRAIVYIIVLIVLGVIGLIFGIGLDVIGGLGGQ
jgi:hypothetical protein